MRDTSGMPAANLCRGSGLNCTTWYDHSIHDWDTDFPVFDPDGFLYKKTMELAKYLAAESKGEVLVSMPDNAGNLDALACLRGTEELLIDFIEEKETVLRAGEVMQSVWEQAVTDVYQILKDNNQGGMFCRLAAGMVAGADVPNAV